MLADNRKLLTAFKLVLQAFVGSFLAMTGCVTVPALCYLCIRRFELGCVEWGLTVMVVVIGSLLSIAGTIDSVLQITAAFCEGG